MAREVATIDTPAWLYGGNTRRHYRHIVAHALRRHYMVSHTMARHTAQRRQRRGQREDGARMSRDGDDTRDILYASVR